MTEILSATAANARGPQKYPVIALVDPIRTARALVDEALARKLRCVIVESTLVPPLERRFECTYVQYTGSIEETAAELRALGVTHLVGGCDPVVIFTDELASHLQIPSNGLTLSEARRDKGKMGQAIRKAGLRTPQEIQTDKFADIAVWMKEMSFPVVIKPSDSGGTDDVYKCDSLQELEARFNIILGKTNLMGTLNRAVVVQEYIDGTEFIVDSVSFDGFHVFTDVLEYEKGIHNGRSFIYEKIRFLSAENSISTCLMAFATQALTALDFKVGAAHMELKINSAGEIVFLEVGGRLAGANIHTLVLNGRGDGKSQVQVIFDALTGEIPPRSLYPSANASVKVFIVGDREGRIRVFKNIDHIRALSSFKSFDVHAKVGDCLHKTTDLAHNIGTVDLAHLDPIMLKADENALKAILAEGIFDLEELASC